MTEFNISGKCDPAFEKVADAFARNFQERGELGASVCITVEGETVVDLWGGVADPNSGAQWTEDTICVVFSCTKGATALCAHRLIDDGALALDAPIANYWPAFAQHGKENATVLTALNHQAGVPAFRAPIKPDGFCDWDYMVRRLELEPIFWAPGEKTGYHMASFGWLVGELVRRSAGKSLGAYFHDAIAAPLALDFHIGLDPEHDPRMAPMTPFIPGPDFSMTDFASAVMTDPQSISHLSLLNNGGTSFNDSKYHRMEFGGGGGVANARALAGLYAPLANDGGGLWSQERREAMRALSSTTDDDATLRLATRFGQGFMLRMDNRQAREGRRDSFLIGEGAFGHTGMGGSASFADPEARLSFGYAMNRMGPGIFVDTRGQSLISAAYSALGIDVESD